jgi:predicted nucleotidyltransferase
MNQTPFEKLKQSWQKNKDLRISRADKIKTQLKHDCVTVYQSYGVKKVILFGSLLNSKFSEHSDVDIYVQPLENKNYWDFQHSLEDILNLNIDLHTNTDDPTFIKKIIDRGEVIYEA